MQGNPSICVFIRDRRYHHCHHFLFILCYLTGVSRPQITVTKARFCSTFHNSTESRLYEARFIVTFFARETRIWCSSTRPTRTGVVSGASHTVATGQSIIVRPSHLVGALTILFMRIIIRQWVLVLSKNNFRLQCNPSICVFIRDRRYHNCHHFLFILCYLTGVSRPQVTVTKARFCSTFHNSTESRLYAARVVVTFFARETRIWCSSTRPTRTGVVSGASHTVATGQSVIVRPGYLVGALTILFIKIIIRQWLLMWKKELLSKKKKI